MPPRDMQPFADVMVLAIKAALAPLQAELAATKQANVDLLARVDELSGLRDRVTVIETKALAPAPVDVPPGLSVDDIESMLTKHVAPMAEKLALLEQKPVPVAPVEAAPSVVVPSLAEIELTVTKSIGALSERLVRLEERAPVPGPAGKDGANGANGLNGKDGADGLGFDDLMAVQTDDRSFTIKAQRGDRVKEIGTARFPLQIQRGVYAEGKSYESSDVVTWAGSQWYCNEATNTKPGESKAWTLVVKRGRDGRDGQDAPSLAVVKAR